MGKIIAIHGTYTNELEASGAEWWQKGSDFATDLRRYVICTDGNLEIESHAWDGRNSEASRNEAARSLTRVYQREQVETPLVVVGHSHGGSIALRSLFHAALSGLNLSNLKAILTVGTPFLAFEQRGVMLSRLDPLWQVTYLSFSLFFFYSILVTIVTVRANKAVALIYEVFFVAMPLLAFLTLHTWMALKDRRRYLFNSALTKKHTQEAFGQRIMTISHSNDEVIAALRGLLFSRPQIFRHELLASALIPLAVVIGPLVTILALAYVGSYCPELGELCPSEDLSSSWITRLFEGAWVLLHSVEYPVRTMIKSLDGPGHDVLFHWIGNILTFVAAFSIFVLTSSLMFFILRACIWRACIWRLSARASGTLNRSTHQQLNELAFGNDDFGLRSIGCEATPFKNSVRILLPANLEAEITHNADAAASRSLQRLRAALSGVISTIGNPSKVRAFDDYLTWSELIHTSYFSSQRFRKLLCITIASQPGFEATAELIADREYLTLRALVEATPPTAISANPPASGAL